MIAETERPSTERAPADQGLVLVVDDTEATRYSLRRVLERAGFRVIEAANGAEALLRIPEKPDLLTLDVRMPELDGFEVCRRLRQDPATSDIPILMISASLTTPEYRVYGLEQGAEAYLAHPFQPRELVVSARTLIRLRRARLEALGAAQEWQATFDALEDGVAVVDARGRILRANRAFAAFAGQPRETLLGQPLAELLRVPPAESPSQRQVRLGERTFRISERRLGEGQVGEGEPEGIVTLHEALEAGRDQRRHSSEQLSEQALSGAGMLALEWDRNSGALWHSDGAPEFFGLPTLRQLSHLDDLLALIHPEDLERHRSLVDAALESRSGYVSRFRLRQPGMGDERWFENRGRAWTDERGRAIGVRGVIFDVTAQQVAEQQRLAERESAFRRTVESGIQEAQASLLRQQESERILFDSVPARIWYKDSHNRMLRVNRPAALASGHSVEELEGASTYDIFPDEAERFYQDDLAVMRSGEPRRGIIERITFNGEVRWLETDKIPFRGPDGEVTGVIVFSVDITDRRRAEEEVAALTHALESRIAELQALVDVIPVGIGIADDPACERIRINAAFAQLLGTPQDVNASLSAAGAPDLRFEVMSKGETVPPEDLPMQRAARERRRIDNVELDIVRGDGSTAKLLASAAPVLDAEGEVRGAVGTCLDITTRHGAEQALRESEERFREMAENISEVLWMTDPWRSKMLYVSPRYEEIFGAPTSALYENPLSFFELVHPQDREKLLTAWRGGHEGDYDEEFRIIRPDGEVYWIRIRAFALRGPGGEVLRIVGIAGDITAWKQVEQGQRLLAAAGEILAASLDEDELLGGIGEVAVRAFADSAFFDSLEASGEIRRVAWKGRGESADRFDQVRGFTPPRGAHRHPVTRAFNAGEATLISAVTDEWLERTALSEEHLQHLRDLDLASVITVPVIARERPIGAMTFIRQRERAEPFTTHDLELAQELARRTALAVDNARLFRESTRALEQRAMTLSLLDTTLASAPIGLGFWDQDLRFVRVNHALAALNGLPVDAHLGRTLREVLPSLAAELEPVVQRVFETGEAVIDLPVTGSSVAAPDDVRHWLESFYPVRDDAGHIRWVGVTVADITDQKRAQAALESLAQSLERLVAERTAALQTRAADLTRSNAELEQFAYVASHDLQEPLRMVANFAQLLAHRYRDRLGGDADEFIGYIVDGVGRMHALITGLLSYARLGREDVAPEPVDLKAACEQAVRQLGQVVSESGATITIDALPTVSAEPTQMVQLFQNLIANALKFRGPEPPRIRIWAGCGIPTPAGAETSPPVPASPHRRMTDPAGGESLIISVGDNGIGIAPEHAQRIFMIFQRLHQRDEYPGTGLGLAISKKIVENLGGQIWVEPNEVRGSLFRFSIPAGRIIEGAGVPAVDVNTTPVPERGATSP